VIQVSPKGNDCFAVGDLPPRHECLGFTRILMTLTEAKKPSLNVLVVDDVAINRVLAMAFLSRLGYQPHEATGGLAALDCLNKQLPVDLIMLDINMPDLDGEKVCQRLRANPAFDHLKIIAYTAHAGAEDCQRYLANGFNAVLVKPISLQRLKDTISALF